MNSYTVRDCAVGVMKRKGCEDGISPPVAGSHHPLVNHASLFIPFKGKNYSHYPEITLEIADYIQDSPTQRGRKSKINFKCADRRYTTVGAAGIRVPKRDDTLACLNPHPFMDKLPPPPSLRHLTPSHRLRHFNEPENEVIDFRKLSTHRHNAAFVKILVTARSNNHSVLKWLSPEVHNGCYYRDYRRPFPAQATVCKAGSGEGEVSVVETPRSKEGKGGDRGPSLGPCLGGGRVETFLYQFFNPAHFLCYPPIVATTGERNLHIFFKC
ncbi:hypothetical protein J6590_063680 [Homalodisca vitripennis]|nr:hypothetical protein J6590_063680 [Homalodisca vitripennis]